jgi:hypothetical protein
MSWWERLSPQALAYFFPEGGETPEEFDRRMAKSQVVRCTNPAVFDLLAEMAERHGEITGGEEA